MWVWVWNHSINCLLERKTEARPPLVGSFIGSGTDTMFGDYVGGGWGMGRKQKSECSTVQRHHRAASRATIKKFFLILFREQSE